MKPVVSVLRRSSCLPDRREKQCRSLREQAFDDWMPVGGRSRRSPSHLRFVGNGNASHDDDRPTCQVTLSRAASKSISSICSSRPSLSATQLSSLDVDASKLARIGSHLVRREGCWWPWSACRNFNGGQRPASGSAGGSSREEAELATEEVVLRAVSLQAVRARAATDRLAAARKLRREIFYLYSNTPRKCTVCFVVCTRERCDSSNIIWRTNL